ncbi:MAG: hypothetical protein EKK46_04465 [Rhodocyclaceae bacterium]|nr:MAG: hypothetical protein EKK46_04465 [Rhodocyclaceae bacterium]
MKGTHRASQSGFTLVMTLVILVVITLSSMAMMLATKAGIFASGNIAFRQAATRAADVVVETGFRWVNTQIAANANALDNTNAAVGYYSSFNEVLASCTNSSTTQFNPATYDFANTSCAPAPTQVGDYAVYYVVHRMATTANTACPAAGCMAPTVIQANNNTQTPGGSSESGASQFGSGSSSVSNQIVYYRITVKVVGPKRNTRYIQAFVY